MNKGTKVAKTEDVSENVIFASIVHIRNAFWTTIAEPTRDGTTSSQPATV